jgi:xanthine dehydrogenase accessory factor
MEQGTGKKAPVIDDRPAIIDAVLEASRGGPPVAVATVMRAPNASSVPVGAKLLVKSSGTWIGSIGGGALETAILVDCREALAKRPREYVQSLYYQNGGESVIRQEAGEGAIEVMIEVIESPATLLIVGGGHVGRSIAAIASEAGFSVAVLDDREAFANDERFPMADRVICGDFVEELRRFSIDPNTYVICVTRGHKQDELSLREVAASNAAYVGMIGSIRRVSTVLTHLAQDGVPREALDRVHTPIGLDIGAETPEEIAVSVVAELVLARRGGTGRKLSEVRKVRVRE